MQKDERDKEGNKAFVVLPNGQVDYAIFTLLGAFIGTLLLQVVSFSFPPSKRWISVFTFFALLILSNWGSNSPQTPSHYEMGLAWVAQHTFLALSGLGLLTALAQLYCCQRFVNTEKRAIRRK